MAWTMLKTLYGYHVYRGIGGLYGGGYGIGYYSVSYQTMVGVYTPYLNYNTDISDTATVHSITIHVDWTGSSQGGYSVYMGVLSSDPRTNWDYQRIYNIASSAPATWTLTSGAETNITVTDAESIKKILDYGLGMRPASSVGDWMAIPMVECTIAYSDPYEPSKVTLTSYPEELYLSDNAVLAWSYSQSADIAQYAVDIELYNTGDGTSYALASKTVTTEKAYEVSLRGITAALSNDAAWAFRVRAYTRSGAVVSDWAVSDAVTLRNIAVEIVSPKGGENKLAAQAVQLRWKKAAADTSANAPYGFTVQYSTNAGETWTAVLTKGTAEKDSSGWYINIPANTFPNGVIHWRVQVWTTQYQSGAYVREVFSAVVQASTSAVSCNGRPLPTLSWTSSSQAAYQVRFADYDSGAVFGSGTSHTVPYVYADGLYAVQVRTQATTGEWSAWTDVQYVQITNVTPSGSVALGALKTRHTAELSWTPSGSFAGYILYRGGVPVYAGSEKRHTDITANGRNVYFVRAITSDGYYVQSASVEADATPATDCLYDYSAGQWISLRYSSAPRRRQFSANRRVSYRYYAGREYPIVFTEGFGERTGTFSYCFRDRAESEAVEKLKGETVCYKGRDGSVLYGVLNSVSRVSEIVQDITFTVTEIDRKERAAYASA